MACPDMERLCPAQICRDFAKLVRYFSQLWRDYAQPIYGQTFPSQGETLPCYGETMPSPDMERLCADRERLWPDYVGSGQTARRQPYVTHPATAPSDECRVRVSTHRTVGTSNQIYERWIPLRVSIRVKSHLCKVEFHLSAGLSLKFLELSI